MQLLRRAVTRWWFGEAFVLALCLGVVLGALLLDPSPDAVSLFGVEIPMMCGFRRLTGMPCPGCGMTRSFSFLAHGDLLAAVRVNFLGPLLFLFVATQVPYRAIRLARGHLRRRGAA